MFFSFEAFAIFLAFASLALLSIYTLEKCRQSRPFPISSYSQFLFVAKSPRYSLASAVGSVFSITYFGAAVVYGAIYGAWFFIFLCIASLISIVCMRALVGKWHRDHPKLANQIASNFLLEYFRHKLSARSYKSLVYIYIGIYLSLLIEEIAFSRLTLSFLFPSHPIIPPLILTFLLLVLFWYLRLGGFRAVVVSDYEQLKVLCPFILAITYIMFRSTLHSPNAAPTTDFQQEALLTNPALDWAAFVFGLLFFTCWLIGALDFYSRLNFSECKSNLGAARAGFIPLAGLAVLVMFLVPAALGFTLPEYFGAIGSPRVFTDKILDYFFAGGSRLTGAIILAGLFCMMFTTIDTLLITLAQVSNTLKRDFFDIDNLLRTLLIAVPLASAFDFDYLSAAGIFSGSLMIIPCAAIVVLETPLSRYVQLGLMPSFVMAVLLFVGATVWTTWLIEHFERQFLIPVGVLASIVVTWGVKSVVRGFQSRREK